METGDTAWLLASSAFVFIMTPGLGFFYGGMTKKSNLLSTITYCFMIQSIITILWYLFGFSLVFGESGNEFIGDFSFACLQNVENLPNPNYGPTIPFQLFFFFQLKFAAITPALILGSVIDRVKIVPLLIFIIFWMIFAYFPIAYWMWNVNGWAFKLGVLDFAGGNVVHISSGFAALACGMQYSQGNLDQRQIRNPIFTLLGCSLLWFGWLGFNGGSGLASNYLAVTACISTNMAASSAGLMWMMLDYIFNKKTSLMGFPSGAICGLVAITPACGFCPIWSSIIIGILGATGSFLYSNYRVHWFGDAGRRDHLDVFGCHGISGIIGSFCTGLFSDNRINPAVSGTHDGAFLGNGMQLAYQLAGLVSSAFWSFGISIIICIILNKIMGLSLSDEEINLGIDHSVHSADKDILSDPDILKFIVYQYESFNKNEVQIVDRKTQPNEENQNLNEQ